MSCTAPALVDNQLQPRRFVVRCYLAASGDSFTMMDGALTRITPSIESQVVSLQHGGGSKDTWILSDAPVSHTTLLPVGAQPLPFSRGAGDLPSRIADDLFWLGRYVERAEMQVRLARAAYRRLIEENGFEDVRAAETLAAFQRPAQSSPDEASAEEFVNYVLENKEGAESRRLSHKFRVWPEFCETDFQPIAGASFRKVMKASCTAAVTRKNRQHSGCVCCKTC